MAHIRDGWDFTNLNLTINEFYRMNINMSFGNIIIKVDSDLFNKMKKMSELHMCGAPCIDPEKIQQSWKDYTDRALEPMLQWVQTAKPRNGSVFQYGEVNEKLKEYEPPLRYGVTFVKKMLLPELSKRKVENVPMDLLAILYTLNKPVPCCECKFLGANLDVDPATGLGEENLFLQFKYEEPEQICSFRIRNFRRPEIAKVEVIKD
ncbi:MAG: hypothetical protein LBI81_03285 [Puniceicoccales bacterium]|jgi:hypothetical protein|nr:hypothetical protein [Puniceicoccales bacterium]